MNTQELLSKCCRAGVKVVGTETMHWECIECGKPCDIWSDGKLKAKMTTSPKQTNMEGRGKMKDPLKKLIMSDQQIFRENKGQMLLMLLKEHKESCDNPNCGISVYLFVDVFEKIVERKATLEDMKIFL